MLEPRCNICKEIKNEYLKDNRSKLETRLFNCAKFIKGGESQKAVADDYGFNQISLSKHLKYHQNPNDNVLIAERFERNAEKAGRSAIEVQDKLIEEGFKQMEEGNLKMTAATLAKVAKDKQDVEEKQKDRSLKIMEMVFTYASREQLPPGISPRQLTGDNIQGEG